MLFHMLNERVSKWGAILAANDFYIYIIYNYIYNHLYIYTLLHRLMYAIESRGRITKNFYPPSSTPTTSKLQDPICLIPQFLLHVEDRFIDHLANAPWIKVSLKPWSRSKGKKVLNTAKIKVLQVDEKTPILFALNETSGQGSGYCRLQTILYQNFKKFLREYP